MEQVRIILHTLLLLPIGYARPDEQPIRSHLQLGRGSNAGGYRPTCGRTLFGKKINNEHSLFYYNCFANDYAELWYFYNLNSARSSLTNFSSMVKARGDGRPGLTRKAGTYSATHSLQSRMTIDYYVYAILGQSASYFVC